MGAGAGVSLRSYNAQDMKNLQKFNFNYLNIYIQRHI